MQPYHYCPACSRVTLTDPVEGTDAPERVCLECGAALLVDPLLIAGAADGLPQTRSSVA